MFGAAPPRPRPQSRAPGGQLCADCPRVTRNARRCVGMCRLCGGGAGCHPGTWARRWRGWFELNFARGPTDLRPGGVEGEEGGDASEGLQCCSCSWLVLVLVSSWFFTDRTTRRSVIWRTGSAGRRETSTTKHTRPFTDHALGAITCGKLSCVFCSHFGSSLSWPPSFPST